MVVGEIHRSAARDGALGAQRVAVRVPVYAGQDPDANRVSCLYLSFTPDISEARYHHGARRVCVFFFFLALFLQLVCRAFSLLSLVP